MEVPNLLGEPSLSTARYSPRSQSLLGSRPSVVDWIMPRWRLLEHWDRDLRSLSRAQLHDRLHLAREREHASVRKGMGRNPKAARDWRARRKTVEEELARRQGDR